MADGTGCKRAFASDWFCGSLTPYAAPSASASSAAPVTSAESKVPEEAKCHYVRMGGDYVEVCEPKTQGVVQTEASKSRSIWDAISDIVDDIIKATKEYNSPAMRYRH